MDHHKLFTGVVDHIKDQRTGLINTTFILVGAPTGGGPRPWPPGPPKSGSGLGPGLQLTAVLLYVVVLCPTSA